MAKKSYIDWDSVGLGEQTDSEIAKKLGVDPFVIFKEREKRGIPAHRKWRKRKSYDDIDFGKKTDAELAKESGLSRERVRQVRTSLGIKSFYKQKKDKEYQTLDTLGLCGKAHDSYVANLTGISLRTIKTYRKKNNIQAYKYENELENIDWANMTNGQVAAATGAAPGAIANIRRRLKKPVCYAKNGVASNVDWDNEPLGKMTDQEIARKHGVSSVTVCKQRQRRNIPAYKKK